VSAATLPGLLEALGELFLVPGACPAGALAAAAEAGWAPPELRAALAAMLAADHSDLDVVYAGLFLKRVGQPPIRLEASVRRTGAHLDPEVLEELAGAYELAGMQPEPGIHPDHLGALLVLFARLLELLDREAGAEALARTLLQEHLEPLVAGLRADLGAAGPAFYGGAAQALVAACALSRRVLA
jgi:TorA maturation chaperone TorD